MDSDRTNATAIEWIAVTVVVAIGAALRLWDIDGKSLWLDEAFSVWVADLGLAELLRFVGSVDHHPPLYYLLLHGWQGAFGDSAGTVRLLSALLSVAAMPFFYLGGRIFVGRTAAWFALLFLAISPFHVRYAQEARMYALMTFLAAVMLWCLAVYLIDSQTGSGRRRAAMVGFAVSLAALMWTHNTAALLAPLALNAGVLIPWLWRRSDCRGLPALSESRFLRGWLAVQAMAFLLWLPWLPRFVHQASVVYADFWIEPLTPYFIWLTLHNFNLAYPEGWFPASPLWDLLYWALAAAGVYALQKRWAVAFLLGTLFLTPVIIEIVISVWRPVLYDRTLIWATLPYYLLIGNGLGWLIGGLRWPRSTTLDPSAASNRTGVRYGLGVATLLALVALSTYSLRVYYVDYAKEDWPSVAEYVAEQAATEDLVLFNAAWGQIPYSYAAHAESVDAQQRGVPTDLFDTGELEARMMAEDAEGLRDMVSQYDDVWLVYTHEWYTDPEGLIPGVIGETHALVQEQSFNGPRVLHYARPVEVN